jgi:hypothetical protein
LYPIFLVNAAWQTRQRRLQVASEGKSKIGAVVDPENLKLPLSIAGAIAGITLIALAYSIYFNSMLAQDM